MRRVALKPLVDYTAVVVAWSAYTMGIFWVQSGEINFQLLIHFPHTTMIGMYVGGVLSFIFGFNLALFLTRNLRIRIIRYLERKRLEHRRNPRQTPLWPRALHWRLQPHFRRYGFSIRWLSCVGSGILMVALLTPWFFNEVQWIAHRLELAQFDADKAYTTPAAVQVAGSQREEDTKPDYETQLTGYHEARAKFFSLVSAQTNKNQ